MTANDAVRIDLQTTHLKFFPDLEKLYSKFYRVSLGLRHTAQLIDCVKIYNMVLALETMVGYLMEEFGADKNNHEHALYTEIIEPLAATLEEFEKVKQMIEECIDMRRAK
jgi:hypothetical protein